MHFWNKWIPKKLSRRCTWNSLWLDTMGTMESKCTIMVTLLIRFLFHSALCMELYYGRFLTVFWKMAMVSGWSRGLSPMVHMSYICGCMYLTYFNYLKNKYIKCNKNNDNDIIFCGWIIAIIIIIIATNKKCLFT